MKFFARQGFRVWLVILTIAVFAVFLCNVAFRALVATWGGAVGEIVDWAGVIDWKLYRKFWKQGHADK